VRVRKGRGREFPRNVKVSRIKSDCSCLISRRNIRSSIEREQLLLLSYHNLEETLAIVNI